MESTTAKTPSERLLEKIPGAHWTGFFLVSFLVEAYAAYVYLTAGPRTGVFEKYLALLTSSAGLVVFPVMSLMAASSTFKRAPVGDDYVQRTRKRVIRFDKARRGLRKRAWDDAWFDS